MSEEVKEQILHLTITAERVDDLTVEDMMMFEDASLGRLSIRELRDFLAQFAVDEQGKKLPEAEAKRLLGRLKMEGFKTVVGQLNTALSKEKEKAVPPKMP